MPLLSIRTRSITYLQRFCTAPLLIVSCLVDQIPVIIEIIEQLADLVPFNEYLITRLLKRGDAQLQGMLVLKMKYPFPRLLNWPSIFHGDVPFDHMVMFYRPVFPFLPLPPCISRL